MKSLSLLWLLLGSMWIPAQGNIHINELPEDHYKYETILGVAARIQDAVGKGVWDLPTLRVPSLSSGSKAIAQYIAGSRPELIFDEQLYDICIAVGGADSLDALAFVLGHELTHVYEQSSGSVGFAKLPGEQKYGEEGHADYLGSFWAFLAGFESFGIIQKLIPKVYSAYQLPDSIGNYPSKEVRIQLAQKKVAEVLPYCQVFDAGLALYLNKNYSEAAACFDHIRKEFPSREMFHNAGSARLQEAMELTENHELPFALPIEVAARTRLKRGLVRSLTSSEGKKQRKNRLLEEARILFEEAKLRDPSYVSSYINLASTYLLMGNNTFAIGVIDDLEQRSIQMGLEMPGNAYTVRAIAQMQNSVTELARKDFMAAKDAEAFFSEFNWDLYVHVTQSTWDIFSQYLEDFFVDVGRFMRSYMLTIEAKAEYEGSLQNKPFISKRNFRVFDALKTPLHTIPCGKQNLFIYPHPESFETGFRIIYPENGDDFALDILCHPTSLDIGISQGISQENVLKKWGEASHSIPGSFGEKLWIYEDEGIVVQLRAGKVYDWQIYRHSRLL